MPCAETRHDFRLRKPFRGAVRYFKLLHNLDHGDFLSLQLVFQRQCFDRRTVCGVQLIACDFVDSWSEWPHRQAACAGDKRVLGCVNDDFRLYRLEARAVRDYKSSHVSVVVKYRANRIDLIDEINSAGDEQLLDAALDVHRRQQPALWKDGLPHDVVMPLQVEMRCVLLRKIGERSDAINGMAMLSRSEGQKKSFERAADKKQIS